MLSTSKYHEFIIGACDLNRRSDIWLRSKFKFLPYSLVNKIFRNKDIMVNDKKILTNYKLQIGDVVKIYGGIVLINSTNEYDQNIDDKTCLKRSERLTNMIIAKNEYFICLNKESNIAMHAGEKIRISMDSLIYAYNEVHEQNYKIVHRLDRQTTGALIIANGAYNAKAISDEIYHRRFRKYYICIVYGHPKNDQGTITTDIDNQHAITKYKIIFRGYKLLTCRDESMIQNKRNISCTVILCKPETGYTHQIRKHMLSISDGIIGDDKYQISNHYSQNIHDLNYSTKNEHNKYNDYFHGVMLLHAYYVSFRIHNHFFCSYASLPPYMQKLLQEISMPDLELSQYVENDIINNNIG